MHDVCSCIVVVSTTVTARHSNVANLGDKVIQLLLGLRVLLGHLFVLGLPLVTFGLEGLHSAFKVAGLDIGLAEAAETC